MHTFKSHRVTFHYNSDFSGDLRIVPARKWKSIEVPAQALVDLILERYEKPKLIAELEQEPNANISKYLPFPY